MISWRFGAQVEMREKADGAAELQSRLSAAESEIGGWASRGNIAASELAAEREARRRANVELRESHEQLSSIKEEVPSTHASLPMLCMHVSMCMLLKEALAIRSC